MKTAIFPGSFDPFTIGHADVLQRGLKLFDRIIIAIGYNEKKTPFQTKEERLDFIRSLYKDEPRVEVCTYEGLTADLAAEKGAEVILRSVRSIKDYEYERDMADLNRRIANLETVFVFARPELAALSSSAVRELNFFGKDISSFIPKN